MKKVIALKWIKALRSGKYKQGQGRLRNNDKYCCLGVLCDLSKQGKWDRTYPTDMHYNQCSMALSNAVVQWSGLQSSEGTHRDSSLANLNDAGWSFKKIATYIEKNWKEL